MEKKKIHVLEYRISHKAKMYALNNPEIFKEPMYYDEYEEYLLNKQREYEKEVSKLKEKARTMEKKRKKWPRNLISNFIN